VTHGLAHRASDYLGTVRLEPQSQDRQMCTMGMDRKSFLAKGTKLFGVAFVAAQFERNQSRRASISSALGYKRSNLSPLLLSRSYDLPS
jgi:hypothetical protein